MDLHGVSEKIVSLFIFMISLSDVIQFCRLLAEIYHREFVNERMYTTRHKSPHLVLNVRTVPCKILQHHDAPEHHSRDTVELVVSPTEHADATEWSSPESGGL